MFETESEIHEIHEIVDRETRAWNEKSVELLLSIFHRDMVWVWPPDSKSVDPMTWQLVMGKFDHARWAKSYEEWFSNFQLERNTRHTRKISITKQGDGAFAVVDIDTLWRS